MTTPNKTGSAFEKRCTSLVQKYRTNCTHKRVYWSKRNYYKPDLVTELE